MNIVVALKQVSDDTVRVPVGADGGRLPDADQTWILSPLDRYALEQAFRLRETEGGEIVVVHVGPDHPPSVLLEGRSEEHTSELQSR